jgi:hypothetical protein
MPPVPQRPPAYRPLPTISWLPRNPKNLKIHKRHNELKAIEKQVGVAGEHDNNLSSPGSTAISVIEYVPESLDSQDTELELVSSVEPPLPEVASTTPQSPQRGTRLIKVQFHSPPPSQFGPEYVHEPVDVRELPSKIHRYLDTQNLEAFYVPPDGNCLYRAATFGPEWTKHDLSRLGLAGYLSGPHPDNELRSFVTDEDIEEMSRRGSPSSN